MPALVEFKVYDQEILLKINTLPIKLREALTRKLSDVFLELREQILKSTPGRYLDPDLLQQGVDELGTKGGSLVGWIEVEDKIGTYPIDAKGKALKFIAKSGDVVFAKHVNHPFLKGSPILRQKIEDALPWIVDQLEEAVVEAL